MSADVNEPGQKPIVPGLVEEAMRLNHIKTLNSLATRCGYTSMTIRRLFLPSHGHRMLGMYRRMADVLGWSLDELFRVCLEHSADDAGVLIAERASERGMSLTQFSKKLGTKYGGGSIFRYINGDSEFRAMRIYSSMSTALGITADNLEKSFATTFGDLHNASRTDRVLESRATTAKSIDKVLSYSTMPRAA